MFLSWWQSWGAGSSVSGEILLDKKPLWLSPDDTWRSYYCCLLFLGDCRLDISTTKKTPTLGLHRIAKLLGNDSKLGRSAGNFSQTDDVFIAELRIVFITKFLQQRWTVLEMMEWRALISRSPHSARRQRPGPLCQPGVGWALPGVTSSTSPVTRGGRQTGERQAGDTQTGDRQPGNTQPGDSQGGESGSRCNGKLQRTKRIEPEPEPADDKDSIASVTIISVPSGIVTPLTSSEPREHREPSLIKQTSLPPPSSHLRNKHLGKRSQSPNSGWLWSRQGFHVQNFVTLLCSDLRWSTLRSHYLLLNSNGIWWKKKCLGSQVEERTGKMTFNYI